MKPRILITVEGGIVEVVGATIECDVIIIDKDELEVGEDGKNTYEDPAITDDELTRLLNLELSDFPSAEA